MKTLRDEINAAIDRKFGTEQRKITMWEHCLGGILEKRPTKVISFGKVTPNGRIWFMDGPSYRNHIYQYKGSLYSKDAMKHHFMITCGLDNVSADIRMRELGDLNKRFAVKSMVKNIVVNMKLNGRRIKVTFKNTTKERVFALLKNKWAAVKMKIALRYAEYMMKGGGVYAV